jgi:hypothetical protein
MIRKFRHVVGHILIGIGDSILPRQPHHRARHIRVHPAYLSNDELDRRG